MLITPSILTDLLAVSFTYLLWFVIKRSRRLPYPPGPRGSFLFGNINDVPVQKQWIAYQRMSQDLGSPMIHVKMLGTHIIVINDYETQHEIFEKRAARYSDRPRMPMLNEVAGFGWNFGFVPSDEQWRSSRRLFDSYFRESESRRLRPQEVAATHRLLKKLLDSPGEFHEHLQLHTTRLILDIGYGIEVDKNDDHYIHVAETAIDALNQTFDQNLVDIIPWIQYLPVWLPGMSWKIPTLEWKRYALAMKNEPFNAVMNGISTKPSMVSQLMENTAGDSGIEDIIRNTVGTLFVAGTHTTVAILNCILLITLLFPEVQQTAHAELDRVVGQDRLPDFADKHALPYIQALCKELLRWTCIVPLGLPHCAIEDDVWVHNGKQYLIPKGAVVIGNSWAMCRDPNVYKNPDYFNPTRYLTKDGQLDLTAKDPDVVFGYRPRHCAGRWMAEDTIFIAVASLLSVFRIESKREGQVWERDFDKLMGAGLVMFPHPFECNIIPRHEKIASLILNAEFST